LSQCHRTRTTKPCVAHLLLTYTTHVVTQHQTITRKKKNQTNHTTPDTPPNLQNPSSSSSSRYKNFSWFGLLHFTCISVLTWLPGLVSLQRFWMEMCTSTMPMGSGRKLLLGKVLPSSTPLQERLNTKFKVNHLIKLSHMLALCSYSDFPSWI